MAGKGTAIFRVTQYGTRKAARDMSEAARRMRGVILQELRESEEELREPFERWAPYDLFEDHDTYHMQDHVTVSIATAGKIEANVRVRAVSPNTGFDYLDVTRFGRGAIVPVSGKVLRFPYHGEIIFTKYVKPWDPGLDWAEVGGGRGRGEDR